VAEARIISTDPPCLHTVKSGIVAGHYLGGDSRSAYLREIARAAAGHAGIEVEFVAVPFEQVQRTLEDGRAEAVFPLTITPERLPLFDFSDPFLVTGGALSYERRIARLKD
jgi:ABC-type amino acid transport substrate-binding protein